MTLHRERQRKPSASLRDPVKLNGRPQERQHSATIGGTRDRLPPNEGCRIASGRKPLGRNRLRVRFTTAQLMTAASPEVERVRFGFATRHGT
jgi:hypothetical protein